MTEQQLNQLTADLQRLKVDIEYRDLKVLSFETKALLYRQLLIGVNPKSKLIQLVNDCSRIALPKHGGADCEFSYHDYQKAFFTILQEELRKTSFAAGDLQVSREDNYLAIQHLIGLFRFKNVQEHKALIQELERQQELQFNEPEPHARDLPKKEPAPKQPHQQHPVTEPRATATALQNIRRQILQNPQDLALQVIYLEQLTVKYQTQIKNYQNRLGAIAAAAAQLESQLTDVPASKASSLHQAIQNFYKAQEVQINEYEEDLVRLHKELKHETRARNRNFYIDLVGLKDSMQENNQQRIREQTEKLLTYYSSGDVPENPWYDIFC